MPGHLYADDLVLCDESEEHLKAMVRCRRRDLKVHADKSKVMVLGREEGLGCKILVNGAQLEQVS